jgi:ribosome biogenesis GTPase
MLTGTVLRARSGFYTVATDQGPYECQLRGRLKRERARAELVVVGDVVTLEPTADGIGVIESIAPRRSRFSRRQPGPRGSWREDLIVANLDQVLAVFACADPPPNPRLIDRFLVVAENNEISAVLVANKIDLANGPAARAIFDPYAVIGYRVIYTSARTGQGLDEVREVLAGRISAISGPSGVGKSTLLNSLDPSLAIATAEVSEALRKGRHTTTATELHPLHGPMGGHVADTPGIRELALWDIPPADLAWCFPEFRPFLDSCRFADCRHLAEPGCGLIAAAERGEFSADRFDSYRRMEASA